MQENVWFSTILHAYGEVDEERKWNEILEVMVSIYTMPSIFPFSYFQLRKQKNSSILTETPLSLEKKKFFFFRQEMLPCSTTLLITLDTSVINY